MDDIYTQWRASLRPKQKKRTYQHFDSSLDLDNDRDFIHVKRAIENLSAHHFLPFLRFIKKDVRYKKDAKGVSCRSIKPRPIMYASHLDAHIYGFYSYIWGQAYEKFIADNGGSESVIAYRKIPENTFQNKSNIHFAREVFKYIQDHGDCVAIVADISKFFDTLKHKTLKNQLCSVLGVQKLNESEYKVLRSLSAFRFIAKEKKWESAYSLLTLQIERKRRNGMSLSQAVYESGKDLIKTNKIEIGIPQGSPVSGLLANIYLSSFDNAIRSTFPDSLYRRYSDDIVLVCSHDTAEKALSVIKLEIDKYSLDVNAKKAFFVKFQRQLDGGVLCTEVMDGEGNPVKKSISTIWDLNLMAVQPYLEVKLYKGHTKRQTKKFVSIS